MPFRKYCTISKADNQKKWTGYNKNNIPINQLLNKQNNIIKKRQYQSLSPGKSTPTTLETEVITATVKR